MPLFRHDLGTEEEYEAVVASVDIVDMGGGESGKSIDTTSGANAKPPTFFQRWWSPLVYIFYLWVRHMLLCCLVETMGRLLAHCSPTARPLLAHCSPDPDSLLAPRSTPLVTVWKVVAAWILAHARVPRFV
jgi:hypothetical protein